MPLWSIAAIDTEPETTLHDWRVMRLASGDRHLVGVVASSGAGRTSSAIVEFDVGRLLAVTESGRTYQLAGKPGYSAQADYTWNAWRHANSVRSFENITPVVWVAHLASRVVLAAEASRRH